MAEASEAQAGGDGSNGPVPEKLSGAAVAGGHTPESIARLPPKLRQRLLQRGILTEQDVKLAESRKIVGAVAKAAPAAPGVERAAMAKAFPGMAVKATTAYKAQEIWVPKPGQQPVQPPQLQPPQQQLSQQVYSAAPVLRPRAPYADLDEEAGEAKRPRIESPADARAAAARAENQEAPVWIYPNEPARAESKPEEKMAVTVPDGPPLPPFWVRVPHEGEHYYWNTQSNEVSWDHPAEKGRKEEPKFKEEHKVLWTDLGKIIGRQGMNLKIIKASIGCDIHVPKQDKKDEKKGKGKDGKGKDKGKKGKSKGPPRDAEGNKIGRGIGDGSKELKDEEFCTVTVTADSATKANGGKRCIQIMLGYGRNVERALADLGVEAKMPSLEDMTDGKSKAKEDVDPMDPAAYSDAPVGTWSSGLKKPGQKAPGGNLPRDAKVANAERF